MVSLAFDVLAGDNDLNDLPLLLITVLLSQAVLTYGEASTAYAPGPAALRDNHSQTSRELELPLG